MSSWLAGAVTGGAVLLAASPYLARVVRTVPDRDDRRWWQGIVPGRRSRALTAGVALSLGALAGYAAGWSAVLPAFVAFALLATPLVIIDIEHHRLPDRLVVLAGMTAAVLLGVAAAVRGDWHALGRAGLAAVIVFALFSAVVLASPASLGFGDVKLAAVTAGYLGWLSWGQVLYGIFAGFLLGALMALPLLASRRTSPSSTIPLGPALIVGALLVAAMH